MVAYRASCVAAYKWAITVLGNRSMVNMTGAVRCCNEHSALARVQRLSYCSLPNFLTAISRTLRWP